MDKRSDYFLIFHEQTHISEIKKAALYAYWIIKLKPLSVVSPIIEKRIQYSYINETFALFILYGVLREKASRLNKEFSPSQEYTRKIAYAFKYWDISKEALILIAEIRKQHIQNVIDNLNVGHSSKNHIKSICMMMFKQAINKFYCKTLITLP